MGLPNTVSLERPPPPPQPRVACLCCPSWLPSWLLHDPDSTRLPSHIGRGLTPECSGFKDLSPDTPLIQAQPCSWKPCGEWALACDCLGWTFFLHPNEWPENDAGAPEGHSQGPSGSVLLCTFCIAPPAPSDPLTVSRSPNTHSHTLTPAVLHSLSLAAPAAHPLRHLLFLYPEYPFPKYPQALPSLLPKHCFSRKPVLTTRHTHSSSPSLISFQEAIVT